MAEELVQQYMTLAATVSQYSVHTCPVFEVEKWKPLQIRKSQLGKVPFVYEANGAVYGRQSVTDTAFAGQYFRFGFPKESTGNIYAFTPDFALQDCGLIADRILAPEYVLVAGVDYRITKGVLEFTLNPFDVEAIPRVPLADDAGVPVTYKDTGGVVHQDELLVLWCYNAEVDNDTLSKTYGELFDLKLDSSEAYRDILSALMALCSSGPVISAVRKVLSAFLHVPTTSSVPETVEALPLQAGVQQIVTNKHVYTVPTGQTLAEIGIGDVLEPETVLTTSVRLHDNVINPSWWVNTGSKLGFAGHIFAAGCKYQLFFSREQSTLTYQAGVLTFPVEGRPEDIEAFQAYINLPENKDRIVEAFSLAPNSSVSFSPLDFLFHYVFNGNVLLVGVESGDSEQLVQFFRLLPYIRKHLPPHVYVLLQVGQSLTPEGLVDLNSSQSLTGFAGLFSIDGSDSAGARPGTTADPSYYKDLPNRLFCLSKSPRRNGEALQDDDQLDTLAVDNTGTGHLRGIKAGGVWTDIPSLVTPPGESVPRRPTNREIPSVLLLRF